MTTQDTLVQKILRTSRIPSPGTRHELEIELASHIEEIVEEARGAGIDDAEIEKLVLARFGDPDEIARQFVRVYRPGRAALRAAEFLVVGVASLILVLGFAAAAQAMLAIWLGLPASTALSLGHARTEIGFFAGLALGYLALHFSGRVFASSVGLKSVFLIAAVFCVAGAVMQALIPPQGLVLGVGLGCAVLLRAVESLFRRPIVRLAGITGALSIVAGFLPTCLRSSSHPGVFLGIIPMGVAVALSCQLLAIIARAFDRRIVRRDFV